MDRSKYTEFPKSLFGRRIIRTSRQRTKLLESISMVISNAYMPLIYYNLTYLIRELTNESTKL